MFSRTLVWSAALALVVAVAAVAADSPPIPGIGPAGPIQKVHTGFTFTEGPTADRAGNLYFTDVRTQKIHKHAADGTLSVIREQSNGANGLMFNAKGELVACEMGSGQVVAYSPDGRERRVLAAEYNGKRFNAPNDLVIDKQGGIYFTDPQFNAPNPRPQNARSVYYLAPDGKVTGLFDQDLPNPNGVILSPDERTLYVIPSGSADMMAYSVESPGKVGTGRVHCTLKQRTGQQNAGGDGVAVDTKGDLYIATGLGIQVFDPAGKHLGTIEFPEQPSNCDFGGPDMKTLYVTARTSLYAAKMEATGHRFAAGR
jgi:gluconolactonase